MTELSHLDDRGEAHMVDVSAKAETERLAVAEGFVSLSADTVDAIFAGGVPKGDVIGVSRVAAIQAAKRTSELIPLCHPLSISSVEVDLERTDWGVRLEARVRFTGRTGVEMEALSAVAVGALTLYDMVKGIDRGAEIGPIRLLRKEGGSSGTWER